MKKAFMHEIKALFTFFLFLETFTTYVDYSISLGLGLTVSSASTILSKK